MIIWTCPICKTDDLTLRYSSGKMRTCKDCQKYKNIQANCSVKRKRKKTPQVAITQEEFLTWIKSHVRKCFYCGVTEAEILNLSIYSQIGLLVESLGVDRIDSDKDYTLDNIVLCCLACNKVKSNSFSQEEMGSLGKTISQIWQIRKENKTNF